MRLKPVLWNWVASLLGLFGSVGTMEHGNMILGVILYGWFVISSLLLIEHQDSIQKKRNKEKL